MIVYTDKLKLPFLIDDEDWEIVSRYSWCIDSQGYPRLSTYKRGTSNPRLHSFLLGNAPNGLEWDHKNQNPLDNRRENIRAVTDVVNQRNAGLRVDNTSGVRGVCLKRGRWYVRISTGSGTRVHIGYFNTVEEATIARRLAERTYWGRER
jgi:hypothetical protein